MKMNKKEQEILDLILNDIYIEEEKPKEIMPLFDIQKKIRQVIRGDELKL